ncbi:MAG: isochorismatase family protein, partial [Pseudomonadota bacterium]
MTDSTERVSDDELKAALDVVFRANAQVYAARGFQKRVGFGKRPALIVIDMANAWTKPGHAFSCAGMEEIIPANQALIEAFRARGLPIVFTTTANFSTTAPNAETCAWGGKIPLEVLSMYDDAFEIDD